jgi:transcriptional regulator with XRE-family HTH domain
MFIVSNMEEELSMLTLFGKFCRKLRIDNGELLKNMADKLGVTPSYLSAVETGKRNVPMEWPEKLSILYSLDARNKDALNRAMQESQLTLKFDLNEMRKDERNLVLAFARELKGLGEDERKKIQSILNKKGG